MALCRAASAPRLSTGQTFARFPFFLYTFSIFFFRYSSLETNVHGTGCNTSTAAINPREFVHVLKCIVRRINGVHKNVHVRKPVALI